MQSVLKLFMPKFKSNNIRLNSLLEEKNKVKQKMNPEIYLANSFLQTAKYTQDSFKKYDLLFLGNKVMIFFMVIKTLLLISLRITKFSITLITNLNISKNQYSDTNNLLISHFVNRTFINEKDPFFGGVHTYLDRNRSSGNVHTSFITHSKPSKELLELTRKNQFSLIDNKLSPLLTLELLCFQFKSLGQICSLFFKKNISILILLKTIEFQFTTSTVKNYVTVKKILNHIKQSSVKNLHLVFEGHNYELLLAHSIKKTGTKVNLYMHQRSPIGYMHTGVVDFLKFNSNKCHFFVSGIYIKEYFEMLYEFNHIEILGSEKNKQLKLDSLGQGQDLLMLPEGTFYQSQLFLELGLKIAELHSNIQVRLRLHPDLVLKFKKLIPAHLPPNFMLSSGDLEEDFKHSKFSIFQSSSSAIEGLFHGVECIYFDFDDGFNLNPFAVTNQLLIKVHNSESLFKYFLPLYQNQFPSDPDKLNFLGQNYFAPFVENRLANL